MTAPNSLLRVEELEQRHTPSIGFGPPAPRWNPGPVPAVVLIPPPGGFAGAHGFRANDGDERAEFLANEMEFGRSQQFVSTSDIDARTIRAAVAMQSSAAAAAGQPSVIGNVAHIDLRLSAGLPAAVFTVDPAVPTVGTPRVSGTGTSAGDWRDETGALATTATRPAPQYTGSSAAAETVRTAGEESTPATIAASIPAALSAMTAVDFAAINRGLQDLAHGIEQGAVRWIEANDGWRVWAMAAAAAAATSEIARRQIRRHALAADHLVEPLRIPLDFE